MFKDIKLYASITKVDPEKRMVYGYISSESLDSQGEVVSKEAIRNAWEDYMKFANVREMHQPSAVGKTKEYSHDDFGTYVGVKVVDDTAWAKVKESVYMGFSIGGRVTKKLDNVIRAMELNEISLVDRPANRDAIFSLVKRDDSGKLYNVKKIDEQVESSIKNKSVVNKKMADEIKTEEVKVEEKPIEEVVEVKDEEVKTETVEEEKKEEPVKEEEVKTEEVEAKEKEEEVKDVVEGEKKEEVKVEETGKKDVNGVLNLADMIGHMKYVLDDFKSRGKDTAKLQGALDSMMGCMQDEAVSGEDTSNKVNNNKAGEGSVAKLEAIAQGLSEFSKFQVEFKELKEKVEKMGTSASGKPQASFAVEKFDSVTTKESKLKDLSVRIDSLSKDAVAANGDPIKLAKLKDEMEKCYQEYSFAKRS